MAHIQKFEEYVNESVEDLHLTEDEQDHLLKKLLKGEIKWSKKYDFKYDGKNETLEIQCDIDDYYIYAKKDSAGRIVININDFKNDTHTDFGYDKHQKLYGELSTLLNKIKKQIFNILGE